MTIQGPCAAASPNTSARIASVESARAGGSPGAVSRGARVLARVVLPLAGGPISRWQCSGAAVAEGKEGRRRDAQSLSQVNRARQGVFTDAGQNSWFENTKLNLLVYIIPVDKLDLGCAFSDR